MTDRLALHLFVSVVLAIGCAPPNAPGEVVAAELGGVASPARVGSLDRWLELTAEVSASSVLKQLERDRGCDVLVEPQILEVPTETDIFTLVVEHLRCGGEARERSVVTVFRSVSGEASDAVWAGSHGFWYDSESGALDRVGLVETQILSAPLTALRGGSDERVTGEGSGENISCDVAGLAATSAALEQALERCGGRMAVPVSDDLEFITRHIGALCQVTATQTYGCFATNTIASDAQASADGE